MLPMCIVMLIMSNAVEESVVRHTSITEEMYLTVLVWPWVHAVQLGPLCMQKWICSTFYIVTAVNVVPVSVILYIQYWLI